MIEEEEEENQEEEHQKDQKDLKNQEKLKEEDIKLFYFIISLKK